MSHSIYDDYDRSLDFGFGGKKVKTKKHKSCYEEHPPLAIGEHVIYGGSCSRPIIKDADIYVGFDRGLNLGEQSYPWLSGESFLYHITDMAAPSDPESFKKLIEYLAFSLNRGKKIHLGCIGGHGRTGTVLSALVSHMTGDMDSTTYVRKHYCEKAVESKSQIRFLKTHYGIKPLKPTKDYSAASTWGGTLDKTPQKRFAWSKEPVVKTLKVDKSIIEVPPQPTDVDVWGWGFRD